MNALNRKDEILDCAQTLIQKQGYNGFSYADIASIVGIRKASLHHHFTTKSSLAVAVVERYRLTFNQSLSKFEYEKRWIDKIKLYMDLYKAVLDDDKLCLCGMLATDWTTLPEDVQQAVQRFLLDNGDWLLNVLASAEPKFPLERLRSLAWQIINGLQGGLIMARALQDPLIFSNSCELMINQLMHNS